MLLTGTFSFSLAQKKTAVIEWQRTIGGNFADKPYSILQTPDGGYIIGGSSQSDSSRDKTEGVKDSHRNDYWVVKLDAMLNIQWQNTIGGGSYDFLYSTILSKDGGYMLCGSSSSGISGDKTSARGGSDIWIIKLDPAGNISWQKSIGGSEDESASNILQTSDGGYIVACVTESGISGDKTEASRGLTDYWVFKIDSTGNIQWQHTFGGSGEDDGLLSLQPTRDGGYIIGGFSNSGISGEKTEDTIGGNADYWVIKLNATGNIQWQNTIGSSGADYLTSIRQTYDGGYILCGIARNAPVSGDKTGSPRGGDDYWIVKLNDAGNILWDKTFGGSDHDYPGAVFQTPNGEYLVAGSSYSTISGDKTETARGVHNDPDYWILKLDAAGNILWDKTLGGDDADDIATAIQLPDGGFVLCGYSASDSSYEKLVNSDGYADFWIVKIKEIIADTISGKVFAAQNNNCLREPNEKGLAGVVVKASPKNYYGITDSNGNYTILADTGTYQVKQISRAILSPLDGGDICPAVGYHNVSLVRYEQDTSEINFANYEKPCPYLEVKLAQSRLRRCFDNDGIIRYCNLGPVDTTNVQVYLLLPSHVTLVSATRPYTLRGDTIIFDIDTLYAEECGEIHISTHVECISGITGLTQCFKAWITPVNECVRQLQPNFGLWDKSDISVEGECKTNNVRFVIYNRGQDMTDSSTYRVYKNSVLGITSRFKLTADDSLVMLISGAGFTYRLEADQRPYYPAYSSPNITIENCGTGVAYRGFVNQIAQNTAAPDMEEICLEIRDSYDPNDKQVLPTGAASNHRVPHKVPLNFTIHFQNTGTDTAFTVIIIDTLDRNLDLSTLELGIASHPYKAEFTGGGKPILKFTFDHINLVDSTTNEAKSHGFITYTITPYDSIPNGTTVRNSADIYFDFNLPVKTNTTQVTINDNLPSGATINLVTLVKDNKYNTENVKVYPNPFRQTTTFFFESNTKAKNLQLLDVNGKEIQSVNIANKSSYELQKNRLANGLYFYVITDADGAIINRGKIIAQ